MTPALSVHQRMAHGVFSPGRGRASRLNQSRRVPSIPIGTLQLDRIGSEVYMRCAPS